jgi:hypothetical protein
MLKGGGSMQDQVRHDDINPNFAIVTEAE